MMNIILDKIGEKMFQEITYYLIFGIPFIVYLGIITIIVFLLTAFIAIFRRKGLIKISVQWHYLLAYISILLATIHGLLGLTAYL
jgi:dolichyl-phosphate-mannose--protein O-mannosyl transferase